MVIQPRFAFCLQFAMTTLLLLSSSNERPILIPTSELVPMYKEFTGAVSEVRATLFHLLERTFTSMYLCNITSLQLFRFT